MKTPALMVMALCCASCAQPKQATPAERKVAMTSTGTAAFDAGSLSSLIVKPVVLNVKHHEQQADNWCWAAVGEMVMESKSVVAPQCKQADVTFGKTTCCPTPTKIYCDAAAFPAFPAFKLHQRASSPWTEQVAFDEIVNKGRAFVVRLDRGIPHYVVVYGISVDQQRLMVHIFDPSPRSANMNLIVAFKDVAKVLKGAVVEVIDEVY